jgi:putative endonuclease
MSWFVYMLECSNGSLYVGLTIDTDRRFARHLSGDGAAHTAKCPPEKIISGKRILHWTPQSRGSVN